MSTKATIVTIVFFIAAFFVLGATVWGSLPEQMASHWNVNDEVNGTMTKFWGVFLMPIIAIAMFGLFMLLPQIDPLKANIEQFREAFNLLILLIILYLGYVWVLTIAWNLGHTNFKMSAAMLPALGLLFMYIGWMLRKAKRNFFIGIRTPWTLSSDQVWNKTHQLGSTMFIVSGALALMGAFFGDKAIWFVMIPLLGSSLFLVVYSYLLYREETKA